MDFIFIKDNLSKEKAAAIKNHSKLIWENVCSVESNDFILCFPERFKPKCFFKNENCIGFISGYVRNYKLTAEASQEEHNKSFFDLLLKDEWPSGDNFTGSFSAFVFDYKNKLIVCNDVIGYYPLYYSLKEEKISISTNLILQSKIFENPEIDSAGALQCLAPQQYYNIGTRTILSNVYRLLPGEFIHFDTGTKFIETKKYDTTLFSEAYEDDLTKNTDRLWEIIKEDMEIILRFDASVNIAQSGGIDSRLILGAIPADKKIKCITIGDKDFYETQLAEKCAKAKDASFEYFPSSDFLFPETEILKKHIHKTEAAGDNEWFALLESGKKQSAEALLMGDICEAIRSVTNNKSIVSKGSRIKEYLKDIFLKRKFDFEIATPEKAAKWKFDKIKKSMPPVNLLRIFNFEYNEERIKADCENDFNVLFELLDKFNLKLMIQYDLLFYWFTNARQISAKQILLMKEKFFPVAPLTSARIIRTTSFIPLENLLYDRLVNKIFRKKEMKNLGAIPTSQIPFVKYTSSGPLKYLIWFYRAKMDEYYIKKIMKSKNPELRYRLCKATNYPMMYQQKNAEANVHNWFSNKFINGQKYINLFKARKDLSRKSTFNQDIVIPASVGIMLDEIKKNS